MRERTFVLRIDGKKLIQLKKMQRPKIRLHPFQTGSGQYPGCRFTLPMLQIVLHPFDKEFRRTPCGKGHNTAGIETYPLQKAQSRKPSEFNIIINRNYRYPSQIDVILI